MAVKKSKPTIGQVIDNTIQGKIQEKMVCATESNCKCNHKCSHTSNAVYGLGFVGAAIYYITTATSFWMGVLGVLKAIVWPAFVVYGLLKQLGL